MNRILATASTFALAATAVLAAPGAALAQDHTPYVAVFAGVDMPDDEGLNGANAAGQARTINVTLEDGAVYGAALGVASKDYAFGRVRGEVEFSARESDLEGLSLNGVARTVRDGSNVSVTAGMINVVYDTPVYFDRVRFSAGAGLGVASIDHEINYLVANAAAIGAIPGQLQIAIPSTETTTAYQLIGGASVQLTPNWAVTADVRYFDLGDVQAERYIQNAIINGTATTQGVLDSVLDADYSTVSATVGLRFSF